MALDEKRIQALGDELFAAWRDRAPVEPLTTREPEITVEDAYRVQLQLIARRLEAGERVIGKKVGLTSKAVQNMLKVDQPDFGHLTSGMSVSDGETISIRNFIQPRAEGEIGFLLKRDLDGPGVTNADVLRATECVMPCFELVDSRVKDWKIKIQDTVADNASSGAIVVGERAVSPHMVDLVACGMVIEKNGELAGIGAGAAALGSPVSCVAWLANTLGRLGIGLKAGEIILSGSLATLVPIAAGDALRVSIGGLGAASVRFSS